MLFFLVAAANGSVRELEKVSELGQLENINRKPPVLWVSYRDRDIFCCDCVDDDEAEEDALASAWQNERQ